MKEICKGLNYFFVNFFHIYHNVTKTLKSHSSKFHKFTPSGCNDTKFVYLSMKVKPSGCKDIYTSWAIEFFIAFHSVDQLNRVTRNRGPQNTRYAIIYR